MDDDQRRVWARMIESADAFRMGDVALAKLVEDLQGLLEAADLQDADLIAQWWQQRIDIDIELHREAEGWPPDDEETEEALSSFRHGLSVCLTPPTMSGRKAEADHVGRPQHPVPLVQPRPKFAPAGPGARRARPVRR